MRRCLALLALILCLDNQPALSAETAVSITSALEHGVQSHGSVPIDGRKVPYTATAGMLLLHNERGRPSARVFYISYTARGLGSLDRRPVTFAYNGGPGVSSTGLNIGAFGPKIVAGLVIGHHDSETRLIDNACSLLDKTDLVFIDAIGTGFSRVVGSATGKEFYGVDEDAQAFTQFIKRYTELNGRSNSPKYLLGVSYGTTRSAVVADDLEQDGIKLSGIVLMSTVLDFPAISGGDGQDLQYWLYLPTEAMIASFYRQNAVSTAQMTRELPNIRKFAANSYAEALGRGDALPNTDRVRLAGQLHAYIGLPVAEILRANLRVSPELFEQQLLADQRKKIGRYDGRVSADALDSAGHASDDDPSTSAAVAAFTTAVPSLMRDTLHFRRTEKYVLTSLGVNERWNWGEGGPSGTNVTNDLGEAVTTNPHLRVLSLNGYYDLATPFFGTEYQLAHLGLAPTVRRNIELRYYRAGHMIFVDSEARAQMKRDLDAFYAAGQGASTSFGHPADIGGPL